MIYHKFDHSSQSSILIFQTLKRGWLKWPYLLYITHLQHLKKRSGMFLLLSLSLSLSLSPVSFSTIPGIHFNFNFARASWSVLFTRPDSFREKSYDKRITNRFEKSVPTKMRFNESRGYPRIEPTIGIPVISANYSARYRAARVIEICTLFTDTDARNFEYSFCR